MKKATIRDIAEAAGVSISSVHLALNDKSGVSEATRARIKRLAEELNYRPNMLASNLKRDTRSVAVVLPPRDNLYFGSMWDALEDYSPIAADYNLRFRPLVCGENRSPSESAASESFSGVVSVGMREYFRPEDRRIIGRSAPLILVDGDAPDTDRICCVKADPEDVGRLTAELLMDTIRRMDGEILVCGVGPSVENRTQIEETISRVLTDLGLGSKLRILNYDRGDETCVEELCAVLRSGRLAGACAVNSRSTRALGEALYATRRFGLFPVIGSGLFQRSGELLRQGVFTALVDKRPYTQCRRALELMTDLLTKEIQPPAEEMNIKLDIIFPSTVDQYTQRNYIQ